MPEAESPVVKMGNYETAQRNDMPQSLVKTITLTLSGIRLDFFLDDLVPITGKSFDQQVGIDWVAKMMLHV